MRSGIRHERLLPKMIIGALGKLRTLPRRVCHKTVLRVRKSPCIDVLRERSLRSRCPAGFGDGLVCAARAWKETAWAAGLARRVALACQKRIGFGRESLKGVARGGEHSLNARKIVAPPQPSSYRCGPQTGSGARECAR